MFKIFRIRCSWVLWCLVTDVGYQLAGTSFVAARSGSPDPFHVLARMCWWTADKMFAVSDEDFRLAYGK